MSKSSEYTSDKEMFGDFLPKVYIDKITLSGREDQGDNMMKVEVEVSLKDSSNATGNFLLFDNHELWDLINIDVAVTSDPKAQEFIEGQRSIQKLAYAPEWPLGIIADDAGGLDMDPQYVSLFDGEPANSYWKVTHPHRGIGAWIRPELFKATYSTRNLTDIVHSRLGERPERGFVGEQDAGVELLKLLPEVAETHDSSAKVIKTLTAKFSFFIHKNMLTNLQDATAPIADDAMSAVMDLFSSDTTGAVPGAHIFPNDLYIFAYARVNTDSDFWEGASTSAGGIDNINEMPELQNEFIGEVAYEHMIDGGEINFREYKYFTEDDRLFQGPLVLNTNGDYVKALNYDNERIANEIADRVLSLINTETEKENAALIYYSYIVSNLIGYAEYPEMFFQLYQQLRLMSDRRTTTSAGIIANAFSDVMEQLKGMFLSTERVYKKMVRNSKYFDRRVPGSASSSGIKFCAPSEIDAGYGMGSADIWTQRKLHSCVLPMYDHGATSFKFGPSPHSKIWLTSDIPGERFDPSGTDMNTGLVAAGDMSDPRNRLSFDRVNADFLKKRINGWFMLNLENMMYKAIYHPTAKHFVLTKKLVHHFGFGVISKYFFVDQVTLQRAAVDYNDASEYWGVGAAGTDNVSMPILSRTQEHVFTSTLTRQATDDPGDGTDVSKTATNLSMRIVKPYLQPSVATYDGDATFGDSDITTGEGYYPIDWFGTNNTTEKLGLQRRRDTFSPFETGATADDDLYGYPEGPGHYGTGLHAQVTHPALLKNPDKMEKILFFYFSEPVMGMFGVEDCSVKASFTHNGSPIKKIHLKYVADYSVINNIGGMCYVIWNELRRQRSVIEDYLAFAERVCSFDNRTGKFNEFFGDQFHQMFYNNLGNAWWTKPVAYYVLVQDLLNNSYGGNSAVMREKTLNIIQSIDPTSGTIYALREFVEDFNGLVNSWHTNFRGMHLGDKFEELAGVYSWHKNFEPRENMFSSKNPICEPSFDFPYGYGHSYHGAGDHGVHTGAGMPLPTGTYPITDAFSIYHTIMESVEYEQYARAISQFNMETIQKCSDEGIVHNQMISLQLLVKRALFTVTFDNPGDEVLHIHMTPITTTDNNSVSSENVDPSPPAGKGIRAPTAKQFEIFDKFLDDYSDGYAPSTSRGLAFIGAGASNETYDVLRNIELGLVDEGTAPGGMRKGAWELFMEATLASRGKAGTSGTEKALAAGVSRAGGGNFYLPENTPGSESVVNKAYDFQVLRERIRKGLRRYVDLYLQHLKQCSGLTANQINNRYFAGRWPFNALGYIQNGPDSQDPFRGAENMSKTRGWGQIDLPMRELIEDLLEGVRRLRVMGFWPYFDINDIRGYMRISEEGEGIGVDIALSAGDDEGGYFSEPGDMVMSPYLIPVEFPFGSGD